MNSICAGGVRIAEETGFGDRYTPSIKRTEVRIVPAVNCGDVDGGSSLVSGSISVPTGLCAG
ncbi:MAG: hypothetical protein AB8G99_16960, partial [Planctomycetaceae bacterium]